MRDRPPYLIAVLIFLIVLIGYILTLAPTVTFWDAGEFITAAHTLGIPHPPGTPLFVLLGRSWDILTPGISTAVATNLMSAMFSAGGIALFFLLVFQSLVSLGRSVALFSAFAGSLISAFSFTVWQNSNETEVYQVAMFAIALMAWLCWLWRRDRASERGVRWLLLIVHLLGLSLGNHLMALLAGPALLVFLGHVWLMPAMPAMPAMRRAQGAQIALIGTLWVAMLGVGTGNEKLALVGGIGVAGAAVLCLRARTIGFAVAAVIAGAVGLTTYAFLYIRAGLGPTLNMADPSTFQSLWDVISREQYGSRSPLDNPLYLSGQGNPGRTLQLLVLQIGMYVQYFDWQWSAAIDRLSPVFSPARLPFTLLFASLGLYGLKMLRKLDGSVFWMTVVLFLTTGLGLVLYLNFKPGFSIGLPEYSAPGGREVRERDYFFTASFVIWGLWAGIGVVMAARRLWERAPKLLPLAVAGASIVALLPAALNVTAATRRGPTSQLARDFAYDLLQSVEPYGVLVTGGDNDQYPLWYLQNVEGVRRDVAIVNTSLVNTDWYLRQLRDSVQRRYQPDLKIADLYRGAELATVPECSDAQQAALVAQARAAGRRQLNEERGRASCVLTLTDREIANLTMQAHELPNDYEFRAAGIRHVYPAGTQFLPGQIAILRIVQENAGRRPIHVATTAGGSALMGLERYAVRQGLTWKLEPAEPAPSANLARVGDTLLDVDRTRRLAGSVFRYARLLDVPPRIADPTDQVVTFAMSQVYLSLAQAAQDRGDQRELIETLGRAYHLYPDPGLARALAGLRSGG